MLKKEEYLNSQYHMFEESLPYYFMYRSQVLLWIQSKNVNWNIFISLKLSLMSSSVYNPGI